MHHTSHQQKEATESHFPKNNTKFFDMHEIREFRFEGTMTVEVRNWSGSWIKGKVQLVKTSYFSKNPMKRQIFEDAQGARG